MGDASGQPSDGLHLLGMPEAVFQRFLFPDITHDRRKKLDLAAGALVSDHGLRNRNPLPALADEDRLAAPDAVAFSRGKNDFGNECPHLFRVKIQQPQARDVVLRCNAQQPARSRVHVEHVLLCHSDPVR